MVFSLLLLGCGGKVKVDESKIGLLEMPILLTVTKGLEDIPSDSKILYRKHLETKMGTEVGEIFYENGDLYKVYCGANESTADVVWEKSGTVAPSGIKKLKKIMASDVPRYVNRTPATSISNPVESKKWLYKTLVDTRWFFHSDPPISTRTIQTRFGFNEKFVRKINRITATIYSDY